MKHSKPAMIFLCLALAAMVTTEVEAGRIKKPAKGARTEKTEEETLPRRFDNYPTMKFMSGILSRDTHAGWLVGETPLYLSSRCVVTLEGSDQGGLQEGAKAVVMGSMVGNAINAWTVNVSQPGFKSLNGFHSEVQKEPGPNSDVGELTNRPE